eukprot:CAMPEP_0182831552 /NCGR_PEP_ID=MMETSP0006_2-20121128/19200_1 /TAXON_ID=97485 /ORGANISM="Prymnesium parvum, Strain Texoma1" /LENGTH=112 /DNA_ID=CAMNT_0024959255 /DNA_START=273 /DNA_END=611 /DNA_ORIENTATION=+
MKVTKQRRTAPMASCTTYASFGCPEPSLAPLLQPDALTTPSSHEHVLHSSSHSQEAARACESSSSQQPDISTMHCTPSCCSLRVLSPSSPANSASSAGVPEAEHVVAGVHRS